MTTHLTNEAFEIFLISWTGQHGDAERIEQRLASCGCRVRVIYSDAHGYRSPKDNWIETPDDHFFGRKFRRIIDEFDGAVLLLVTVDVDTADWPSLVEACRRRFRENAALAVWSPDVDYSPWRTAGGSIEVVDGERLHRVVQTDSIVWAMSRKVVNRLARLDYAMNTLGWGVDTAAAWFCHANGYLVAIDDAVQVSHPRGAGYDEIVAKRQKTAFLRQLSWIEKRMRKPRWRRLAIAFWRYGARVTPRSTS